MNKKGFTLIELLAVIVILAIVATIASPIILNIISTTKEKAHDESVRSIIKSVEMAYANSVVKNSGVNPWYEQVVDEYNSMMDNTNWDDNQSKIFGEDIICNVSFENSILMVTCELSDKSNISSKPLLLSTAWEARGFKTSYIVYDEIYNGDPGDIKLLSNGDLVFLGDDISSSDIESKISDNEMVIYSDGFSVTEGEDSFLFVITGNNQAMAYLSSGTVTTDRTTIMNSATQAGTVANYKVSFNPWSNMSSQYITFDTVYSGPGGDIEFYSNGDLLLGDLIPKTNVNFYMNNDQLFVYSDGILFSPDGTNYFLFVSNGDGATLYMSNSTKSDNFDRQSVEAKYNSRFVYTLSS